MKGRGVSGRMKLVLVWTPLSSERTRSSTQALNGRTEVFLCIRCEGGFSSEKPGADQFGLTVAFQGNRHHDLTVLSRVLQSFRRLLILWEPDLFTTCRNVASGPVKSDNEVPTLMFGRSEVARALSSEADRLNFLCLGQIMRNRTKMLSDKPE
jgi:hypothetical protein